MTAFACLFNPFANTFLWMNSFPNELPLLMHKALGWWLNFTTRGGLKRIEKKHKFYWTPCFYKDVVNIICGISVRLITAVTPGFSSKQSGRHDESLSKRCVHTFFRCICWSNMCHGDHQSGSRQSTYRVSHIPHPSSTIIIVFVNFQTC